MIAPPSHTSPERPLIVWCAGVSWSGVAGTDRHMASALARYVDILWVDPPVSPVTPGRFSHGASRSVFPTLEAIKDGIVRLSPRTVPLHTRGPLRRLTAFLERWQIRRALHKMWRRPAVVVASHFDDVLGGWGDGVLKVFYGTDDYVGGANLTGDSRRLLEQEEKRQLQYADVLVAVSTSLAERWRGLGFARTLAVVPNGVCAENYAGMAAVAPVPLDLPRPVAGFVGHLSSRIDIRLLESIADAGCSLLLVGPLDPRWEPARFRNLVSRPGVLWTGAVEFERLPGFLKAIDVGITPYAASEFNRASFPLKTLEYLAAGKPAVSTDLPAVRWLDTDLILVASERDFGAAVKALAASDTPAEACRRQAFAAAHSWSSRARDFAAAIGIPVR